jgi:hypothetical protein
MDRNITILLLFLFYNVTGAKYLPRLLMTNFRQRIWLATFSIGFFFFPPLEQNIFFSWLSMV